MNLRRITLMLIVLCLSLTPLLSFAAPYAYAPTKVGNFNVKAITIDLNNKSVKPIALTANNQISSTQTLASMAQGVNAIAAINGTYFEAYQGTPVPWGTIIKDGKVLHVGNTGSVVGFTSDNKLLIDNLTVDFEGYINGEFRAIPWRINHPSTEPDAITIFTPEYGKQVTPPAGAKSVIVTSGKASKIVTGNFSVPYGGFAISYNSTVVNLVDERYKVGDTVSYKAVFKTKHTNASDWANVTTALGAGPSLIIKGKITADGAAEGFWEAKINTSKAARSFIGSNAQGKVIMGSIPSATLKEAAAICQGLGLTNAMCLDGGGSVALYTQANGVISSGRNINNALAFVLEAPPIQVSINGTQVSFNSDSGRPFVDSSARTQVPLRVTMEAYGATVEWSSTDKTATVVKNGVEIKVPLGANYIFKDGEKIPTDTGAVIKDGRTYLPIRAVVEGFGGQVDWVKSTQTVTIK